MKLLIVLIINLIVIGFNVRVSESAVPSPGVYKLDIPCGTTAPMISALKNKYHENIRYKGLTSVGVMKLYSNKETKTFTVVLETSGFSCLVMAGGYLMEGVDGVDL